MTSLLYVGATGYIGNTRSSHLSHIPCTKIIVGCKGDFEKDRKVSESEAADFAHANRLECLITSSKSGVNVEEVFAALFRTKTRLQAASLSGPAASDASKDKTPSRQRGNCTIQ
jgi:hypothetical protein